MNDNRERADEKPEPKTPAELLRALSDECAELDRQAERALYADKDTVAHLALVRKRAELVAGLPDRLDRMREEGVEIPREVDSFAFNLAGQARTAVEEHSQFAMSALLNQKGDRDGDPDVLQRMAEQLEAPKETQSAK